MARARDDATIRQTLTKSYKQHHVRPVLQAYDNAAFFAAASDPTWPCNSFQTTLSVLPQWLLEVEMGSHTWRSFQAWSIVRALGRWPLALYGKQSLPRALEVCPLCSAVDATIEHILFLCPCTLQEFQAWRVESGMLHGHRDSLSWEQLRQELFQFGRQAGCLQSRIAYVTACIEKCALCTSS